jgi:glucose/arabinose dehydrogenase
VHPSFILPAACVLLASLAPLAKAQSPALGSRPTTLSGKSAFGDWRIDAPLVRRKIVVDDLPAPHATRSVFNVARIVAKPASAAPKVPPGFRADLVISGLQDPCVLRIAPNGDVCITQTATGRIRVLRIPDNTG